MKRKTMTNVTEHTAISAFRLQRWMRYQRKTALLAQPWQKLRKADTSRASMSHCLTNEKDVFIYALFDIFPVFLLIKAFHLKIKMTFLVIYKVHTITVYKECNFLQFLKVLSTAVASKWNLWVSCCDVFLC